MAQRNDLAEKKRIMIDGEEIPGLVSITEIPLEKGVIDVPEFSRIRKIQNGITTVPVVSMVYKIQRDSRSLTFFRDWYLKDETHDITVIRTDASGAEFARTLLASCECTKYVEPEFDASSPTYAKVSVDILPYEVTPIEAA